MSDSWLFFLLLTIASLICQAFYSMLEMASVSFNKVRLQYYVSKGMKRAIWLTKLLKNPTLLFGTTLIGVNGAMQFGSECARRFYASLGANPDWAPLSQVIIVLIVAELAPMFAARRYAENVAMFGVPLLYLSSIILRPVIAVLYLICRAFHALFGISTQGGLVLTREELQKAIEERDDPLAAGKEELIDPVLENIFSLKNKVAKDLMEPPEEMTFVSADTTIATVHALLKAKYLPFIPVYQQSKKNIVGILYPRDLLRASSHVSIAGCMRSPWFIVEKAPILHILKECKHNNQSIAVVLNKTGHAVGLLTLDAIVDEIFGQKDSWISLGDSSPDRVVLDRTFNGNTPIKEVNLTYNLAIPDHGETLEQLMEARLGHHPEKGEEIRFGPYELSVKKSSLIGGTIISVKTVF